MAELIERAWAEYLAHCRGADPDQYVRTEAQAWSRLQRALLPWLPEPRLEPEPESAAPPS